MLGTILYLHVYKLLDSLAVNQELNPNRFVKVIEEMPVKGGKSDEQYMKYKVQSVLNESKVYVINNYLSPFNYSTLEELNTIIDQLKPILSEERVSSMNSILEQVNNALSEKEEAN